MIFAFPMAEYARSTGKGIDLLRLEGAHEGVDLIARDRHLGPGNDGLIRKLAMGDEMRHK